MKVHIEKGCIVEVGDHEFDRHMTIYSHILLESETGEPIRINNVMVDSSITPKIRVGNHGSFAIAGKDMAFGMKPKKNAVLGFADSSGLALASEPKLTPIIRFAVTAVVVLLLLFFISREAFGIGVLFAIPAAFGLLLAAIPIVRGKSLLSRVRRKFAELGIEERAAKVY